MRVDIRKSDGIDIVRPHNDIRITELLSLKSHIELLEKSVQTAIAIDLSMVSFIDSSGIGLIANLAKKLARRNVKTALFNYTADIKELLDLTGIEQSVLLYNKEKDMIRSITEGLNAAKQ